MTSHSPYATDLSDTRLPPPGCPAHQDACHITGDDLRHDPAAFYEARRRAYGGVVPVVLDGVFAWLVLGYAELKEVTQRGETFTRDSRYWRPREGSVPEGWPLEPHTVWRPNAVFAGGEEHTRLRGALTRALGKVKAQRVRRSAVETGHRLIDTFVGAGRTDLLARYALPLPLLTLMRLFGFPPAAEAPLQRAIAALLACGDDAPAAARQVMDIVTGQVRRRREEPAGDLTTWLIQEHDAMSPGMSRDAVDTEIREQIWLTINAGHGATAVWIANAIEQLVSRRDVQAGMWAGWMDVQGALRATLWERTPLQNVIGRWATRDVVVGGRHIQAGDMLVLGLAGANTDPCHGSASDRADFATYNEAFFSWGNGPHQCPVPDLAQAIARAAVECLWDRIPDVHLTDPGRPVEWEPGIMMRCPRALPVSFDPAQPHAATRRRAPTGGC
ncbi:cytochrome P450 [Streptomyces sp. NPDC052020]|uniref:cytochrome P450 n=1 Tax=Streptomyces sp. NPDC052020 TaxID=3155677 RepID=UPI00341D29BE